MEKKTLPVWLKLQKKVTNIYSYYIGLDPIFVHQETKGRNLMFYDLRNKTITLLIRDQTKIYLCMAWERIFILFHISCKFTFHNSYLFSKPLKRSRKLERKNLSIVLILSHTVNFLTTFIFNRRCVLKNTLASLILKMNKS